MSDLIEKVKAAISETSSSFYSLPADNPEWMLHHAQARAAIAAVAEWLDPNARPEIYGHDNTASEIVAAALLKQLEQPK